eukprot:7038371-Prymnesium_polylepis.1
MCDARQTHAEKHGREHPALRARCAGTSPPPPSLVDRPLALCRRPRRDPLRPAPLLLRGLPLGALPRSQLGTAHFEHPLSCVPAPALVLIASSRPEGHRLAVVAFAVKPYRRVRVWVHTQPLHVTRTTEAANDDAVNGRECQQC